MDKSRDERREDRKLQAENSKEFIKNSWKLFLVMFAVLIVMWVLGNLFGFFN